MELRVNLTTTKMNFALRKEEKKRNPFGRLEKSSRGQRKIPVWHLSKEEMAAGSIRSNRRHGSNHFVFGTRPAPFEFRGERVATLGVASPVQVFSSSSLVSSKLMLPGCDHGLLFYNDVIMVCFFLLADLVAFFFFWFFLFVFFLAKRLLLGACFPCRAIIYSISLSPTLFSLLNGRCYQLFLFIRVDGSYLWASRFVTPGGGSCFFFYSFFFLVWSAREKKNRNKNLLLSVPLRSEPNKKKHTGENTLLRENGFKKKKEIFVLAFDRQFHYSRRLICRPDLPRGIFFFCCCWCCRLHSDLPGFYRVSTGVSFQSMAIFHKWSPTSHWISLSTFALGRRKSERWWRRWRRNGRGKRRRRRRRGGERGGGK